MNHLPLLLTLFGLVVCSPSAAESDAAADEVALLRQVFSRQVSDRWVEEPYALLVYADAYAQLTDIEAASGCLEPQYGAYVDRNAERQLIVVFFFDGASRTIVPIGWDHVSTGNPKRSGYFVTPCGVFTNAVTSVGYRALGTKNAKGWRGLGEKGSRVWDFGWQWTEHYVRKQRDDRQIRLLLHATDPVQGESRLGRPDSKGCVRISAKLNAFLDRFGILDADFEAAGETFAWLLHPDRQPVSHAGRYLIVGDSTRQPVRQLVAQASTP